MPPTVSTPRARPEALLECLSDDRWNHRGDVATEPRELLDGRRSQHEILRIGWHEDGLDLRIEALVDHGELELVPEIGNRSNTANHYAGTDFLRELHDELVPEVHLYVGKPRHEFLHHGDPFVGVEGIVLVRVHRDHDVNLIVDLARAFEQVQVSVGGGIERPREKRSQHEWQSYREDRRRSILARPASGYG